MIKIYATPKWVSSDIQIHVRTLEQIIEIIKRAIRFCLFFDFIEYEVLLLLP